MNYQRNPMRYPGVVDNGQSRTEPQLGRRPGNETVPEGGNGCLQGMSLAMVYSPCQSFQGLHTPEEGLCRGTIFIELEKPFYGARRVK